MKTVKFFASFMAMALTGSVAFAADVEPVKGLLLSGDFSLYGGFADVSDPDDELDDTSYLVYGGTAVASIPFGDAFSVQFDVLGEDNNVAVDDEGAVTTFGVGGHLSLRDPEFGLVGVFGGFGQATSDTDDAADVNWFGAEGQFYLDAFTLYGQVGWAEADNDHDPLDWSDVFARGAVRYFFADNFMLQGDLSYTKAVIHSDDLDSLGWGVKAKYGFGDMPVYLSAEYRGTQYDGHGENSATEHVGLLGLSVVFGASSLLEQDRYGATLETPSLPLRASAWTSPLD